MTLFFDDAYEEGMRKLVEGCGPWATIGRCPPVRRCAGAVPGWPPSRVRERYARVAWPLAPAVELESIKAEIRMYISGQAQGAARRGIT